MRKFISNLVPLNIKYLIRLIKNNLKYPNSRIGAHTVLNKSCKVGNKSIIFDKCNLTNSIIGDHTAIYHNSNITDSRIGNGTYIANNSHISSSKIGAFCSIGSHLHTISGRHPTDTYVSTHPSFYSSNKQAGFTFVDKTSFIEYKYPNLESNYKVIIGNDVWIGSHVKILDGIKIGDGAIIGAGSIITKDIEPYSINIGIPSKKIKKRFSNSQIDFLLDFKWWTKSFEWIKNNSNKFNNINEFIEFYKNKQ